MKRPASPTWRHFSLLLLLTLIKEAMTFKVASDPSLIQSNASSAAEEKASEIISAVDHCLAQRMVDAETDDWKLERLNKVRTAEVVMRLVRAKISLKEFGTQWNDDEAVVEAVKMAGRQAAEEIAHREFEASIRETLSGSHLNQEAVEEFAKKMKTMAEMCGKGEEAAELVKEELAILKSDSKVSTMESTMAHEMATYVDELCQVQVMDVDFFVGKFGHVTDCNELIGVSLASKMHKETQKLDYFAKTSLVLHDEENGVGHHFVKLLKGETSDSTNVAAFRALLHNATQKSAEHLPTMSRLRLIDLKHYEHVHGFTVEKYCNGTFTAAADWVKESTAIQNYVDCLCTRQQPSLLCDAQHMEELETLRPSIMSRLQRAKRSLSSAALLEVAESFKSKGIGLGPCTGGAFECSFCVSGQCVGGGGLAFDHLGALTSIIKGPQSCVTGECSVCFGVKPGDALSFILSFGVSVATCNNAAAFFTSFHIWASVTLCIGGVLGKIASAIGWSACAGIAHVAYYPFINKMTITLSLPIFIPPPLGVAAPLEVNLNLGDLTPAVYSHCGKQGHGEYNCLQSMFNARGPTGVAVGVDVLLGIQVPVLGTVGKWVRILGFEMAEKDNSRELAMNKAGVTIEYIGKNSGGGEYCGKTFSNVNCWKKAGNKGYRANAHDQHGDRFNVYRNPNDPNDPRALCVRRVDKWNGGWGMELELACKVNNNEGGGGGILVPLGMTHHDKKCVMPPEPVNCPWWAGNKGHRLGFDGHDAGFEITEEGGRICGHLVHRRRRRRRHRRRRRNSNGWDMNLVLECDSKGHDVNYVVQDINFGSSNTNMKCVLPTHRIECEWDAGNHHKRANDHKNGDTFHIWNSHTNHLCVKRTDAGGGWGMDLRVQCKQYEQLWGKTKVVIGSSHYNEKCVHQPQKGLRCADLAGNREYRSMDTDKGDAFYIEQRDGHVCARRTDGGRRRRHRRRRRWTEGWGVNLEIDCKVMQGPWDIVPIGGCWTPSHYRCFLPEHRVVCDPEVNWHHPFIIWEDHTQRICARRTDGYHGWTGNLQLECQKKEKRWTRVQINFGTSWNNEKCIDHHQHEYIQCDYLAGNPEYRLWEQHHGDSFYIEHKNNQICARRTDNGAGWGLNLQIHCKQYTFKVRAMVEVVQKAVAKATQGLQNVLKKFSFR